MFLTEQICTVCCSRQKNAFVVVEMSHISCLVDMVDSSKYYSTHKPQQPLLWRRCQPEASIAAVATLLKKPKMFSF